MDKAAYLDFVIQIIRRSDEQKGFEVLPRRWVVERTFGWMTRGGDCARLEARIDVPSNDPRRHGRQHATPHRPSCEFST